MKRHLKNVAVQNTKYEKGICAERSTAKKIIKKKKMLYNKGLLKKIELLSAKNAEVRNFYKKVNYKRNGYKAPAGICRDRSGKRVLVEPEQCLKEWANYFEDLLNAEVETEENIGTDQEDEGNEDAPLLEKIIEAIRKIKQNKAAEIDDIPGELIKNRGMKLAVAIHDLVHEVETGNSSAGVEVCHYLSHIQEGRQVGMSKLSGCITAVHGI